jgi:hypothetical protein
MFARGAKLVGLLGVSVTALFLSDAAAESAKDPGAQKEERPALRTDVQPRDAAPRGEAGKIAGFDPQLTDARDQAEIAASRVRDLDQQTQTLDKD